MQIDVSPMDIFRNGNKLSEIPRINFLENVLWDSVVCNEPDPPTVPNSQGMHVVKYSLVRAHNACIPRSHGKIEVLENMNLHVKKGRPRIQIHLVAKSARFDPIEAPFEATILPPKKDVVCLCGVSKWNKLDTKSTRGLGAVTFPSIIVFRN
jgi:hypothetical protein